MYIGRRPDGSVYGAWAVKQADDEFHPGLEEVADDHPDLIAFKNRPRNTPIDLVAKVAELDARIAQAELSVVAIGTVGVIQ